MKSAEARDEMVARVNAAHGKWPTFDKLPAVKSGANVTAPCDPEGGPGAYIAALYAVCEVGEVLGRWGGSVVGKRL